MTLLAFIASVRAAVIAASFESTALMIAVYPVNIALEYTADSREF